MTKPKSKTKTAVRSTKRKPKSGVRSAPTSLKTTKPGTKHSRILAMLRSPGGATIAPLWPQRNGSSNRCADFSLLSFAKSSVLISHDHGPR
jgi:hypothetical protein